LKNIVILGSSGSIGKNALWVAERFPEEFRIFGLSVHSNIETLNEQIGRYNPRLVCVSDESAAGRFLSAKTGKTVDGCSGENGLGELASHPDVDIVVNAVVGFAGLRSTLAAARAGKRIALANKESMVAGGDLVNKTIEDNNAEIIPVDSEHSAIFQCLKTGRKSEIRKLILTSSGGPFRELPQKEFQTITIEQALRHPTWKMGKKITIDSATLMNKGLEIIEAVYLFGLSPGKIEVVIHPQSIIHSMVEFVDGSIIAQLSRPDMRLPIQYALFYPERRELNVADLAFDKKIAMDFEPPDENRFPSLRLARLALETGKTAPTVFNAANEVAVEAFLNERIGFGQIFQVVEHALKNTYIEDSGSIETIIKADKSGREAAFEYISSVDEGRN
jgi:1-deoxy-D-xylulose-5-phosphate reductoisomerase